MTCINEVQQQLHKILKQSEALKEQLVIQREEQARSNAEFKEFTKELFTGMNVQLMQLASLIRDAGNYGERDSFQYCPENQPLIDAPQVFEESPKPNTYTTKSNEWDGNGQENSQEGFEVVSSKQLDGFHTNRGTSNAQQETKIAVQEEDLKLTLHAYGVAMDVGCSGEKAGDICRIAVHQNERHQGRAPEYLAMKESLLDVVRKSCPSGNAIAFICHRLVFDPGGKMVSRLGSVRGALIQEGKDLVTYALINAIAVREILKKYDKVHYSKQGQAFKSRAQSMHVETFQSPWLCELMAFHINLREKEKRRKPVKLFDGCYPKFTDGKPSLTSELFDSVKLDIDLTCSNCLDTVFDPAALTCGHIFCYTCAYSAASVTIVDGLQGASPKEKCSLCRGGCSF